MDANSAMPTCKCGKTVTDWRGARGHVQFTEGGVHGEEGEVPDDWKDLFDADDEDGDEGGEQDGDDDGGGEADPSPPSEQEADSDEHSGSQESRLKKALTDDVRHLWGGA